MQKPITKPLLYTHTQNTYNNTNDFNEKSVEQRKWKPNWSERRNCKCNSMFGFLCVYWTNIRSAVAVCRERKSEANQYRESENEWTREPTPSSSAAVVLSAALWQLDNRVGWASKANKHSRYRMKLRGRSRIWLNLTDKTHKVLLLSTLHLHLFIWSCVAIIIKWCRAIGVNEQTERSVSIELQERQWNNLKNKMTNRIAFFLKC